FRLDWDVRHLDADDPEDEAGQGEDCARHQVAAAPDAVVALGEIDLRLRHRGVPGEEDLVEGAADALPVVEILGPELPQLLLHQLQLALGLLPQRRLDARRPLPDAGPAQLELLEEEAL